MLCALVTQGQPERAKADLGQVCLAQTKQIHTVFRRRDLKVLKRRQGGNSPARCALQIALLYQIRLNHNLNRVALLSNAGCDAI